MKKCSAGFLLVISIIYSQTFDRYFDLLEQGRLQEVRDQLPELRSKYPYEPAVPFLYILLNTDGDSTIIELRDFILKFPDSEYTDDAEMKIGEYLYSRGLYSQASQQLKKIPIRYTNSDHFQRAVDLLTSSFNATGETDSAQFYVSRAKSIRSDLKVDHYSFNVSQPRVSYKKLIGKDDRKKEASIGKTENRPWVVQLGAFGKYDNARRLKNMVKGAGYPIEIVEVMSNSKRLHAVRISRFVSEKDADKVGREIKAQYGVKYRVLNRP